MNKLGKEKSAYLLQHAANPVHWQPWGFEAFEKAKKEKKLLLISIGYSSCHWCHVMEYESFENEEVAKLLNEHFVAIKVDREEHPDVDHFYMDALHTMTSRGGWPLNVFTTDDRKAFFGGTYFPQESFVQLLTNIVQVWEASPEKIIDQSEKVFEHMQSGNVFLFENSKLHSPPLEREEFVNRFEDYFQKLALQQLQAFDPVWGGFGQAPKFPRSHALSALLRAENFLTDEAQKKDCLHAVSQTLKGMTHGGMWDHVGGGYHRYSTDNEWLAPHFEKMLYDQALLLKTLAAFYVRTQEAWVKDVACQMLHYLERDMRLKSGAFAAATDADSEGVEGKYFVWSFEEIRSCLKSEESDLVEKFCKTYDVSESGNWDGVNILRLSLSQDWNEAQSQDFTRFKKKLLDQRFLRIPPLKDEKAIVSWNAWVGSALFEAAYAFADDAQVSQQFSVAADKTLSFLKPYFANEIKLPHIVYGEETFSQAHFEDLVAVCEFLQRVAQNQNDATSQNYIEAVDRIVKEINLKYRNSEGRLSATSLDKKSELPLNTLADEDGATPSAYSTYLAVLMRQSLLTGNRQQLEEFFSDLPVAQTILEHNPLILTYLLEQLPILKNAICLKIPYGAHSDLLKFLSSQKIQLSGFVVRCHEAQSFEICGYDTCYFKTESLKDFKGEILSHYV
jgi:uncharacterized protein